MRVMHKIFGPQCSFTEVENLPQVGTEKIVNFGIEFKKIKPPSRSAQDSRNRFVSFLLSFLPKLHLEHCDKQSCFVIFSSATANGICKLTLKSK